MGSILLASAFEVTGPILLKLGIDSLKEAQPLALLYLFSGLILLAAGITGVFRFFMRDLIIGVSRFVEADLRDNYFKHILRLPPTFFDLNQTGDLMARSTEDVERVRMVVGPALLYSISTMLTLIFSAVMMIALDLVMASWVLALAPFVGLIVFIVARKLHRANLHQQAAYSDMTSHVQETLSGIRVIKAFVREAHEASRFSDVCQRYFKTSLEVARVQSVFMPVLSLLIGLGITGILWVGGMRIAQGLLTLGEFIAFMSYLSLMTWPMIALGWVTHLYQRGSASYGRIQAILANDPQFPVDMFDREALDQVSVDKTIPAPDITYQNIRFRYRKSESDVLSDISFSIPSGSMVAIVGRVGSGKSSLVRLLPRLYAPESGEIMLDGRRWDEFDVPDLRELIGYVDQTPFMFSAKIGENIAIGKPGATIEEIESAAAAACFDEDIMSFPDAFNTRVGERGVTLSGGQQQRLTIARAILADPPILVLDDALSAVDSDTETEILRRLKSRHNDRTTLFVTHRLAAAEQADKILVVEKGRIVEEGTHSDLLTANSHYAAMYRRQRLTEELGAIT